MPLQATSGAASYDAFGGGAAAVPQYIEDVFQTWLYTGTGSAQTITNNIDLSTKGGLVWIKSRSAATVNKLIDTSRGVTKALITSTTAAQTTDTTGLTAFGTTGFTIGADSNYNTSAATYVSWTLRKQPKFFDVVTFTTEASNTNQRISHSLGSVPGCIIVKRTDGVDNWFVWHRSLPTTTDDYLYLNTTAVTQNTGGAWGTTGPTSTDFGVDDNFFGGSRACVAYVFAHNAGGFGLTGTDNVISCGSFSDDASGNATVNLGFEPQWILQKQSNSVGNWFIADVMRGMSVGVAANLLRPNLSSAESAGGTVTPTATGFTVSGYPGSGTYIYIAIRRGPMKVPTSGTSVLGLSARTGTGANATVTGGQTADVVIVKNRGAVAGGMFASRLTANGYLQSTNTVAENTSTGVLQANPWDVMDGVKVGTTSSITNASSNTFINYLFKRAPSFMDIVCFTGTGSNRTVSHNLQAVPELIIFRNRATGAWDTYSSALANTQYLVLNTAAAAATGATRFNSTTPTSSVFSVGTSSTTNGSGSGIIAFLFSTCAGVSKLGSYTGNGTTQTIDCGLTAGARLVLIKSTNASGGWYFYDTARGMTLLTDPHWVANTTQPEVATLGSVRTVATGFALDATIFADINVDTTTYIFLAIA